MTNHSLLVDGDDDSVSVCLRVVSQIRAVAAQGKGTISCRRLYLLERMKGCVEIVKIDR